MVSTFPGFIFDDRSSAVELVGRRRPVGRRWETRHVSHRSSTGLRAAQRRASAQPTVHKSTAHSVVTDQVACGCDCPSPPEYTPRRSCSSRAPGAGGAGCTSRRRQTCCFAARCRRPPGADTPTCARRHFLQSTSSRVITAGSSYSCLQSC